MIVNRDNLIEFGSFAFTGFGLFLFLLFVAASVLPALFLYFKKRAFDDGDMALALFVFISLLCATFIGSSALDRTYALNYIEQDNPNFNHIYTFYDDEGLRKVCYEQSFNDAAFATHSGEYIKDCYTRTKEFLLRKKRSDEIASHTILQKSFPFRIKQTKKELKELRDMELAKDLVKALDAIDECKKGCDSWGEALASFVDIETNIHNKLLEKRKAERIEERAVKLLSGGKGE